MEQKPNPNEKLIPIYDGDELIWVTPPEYYIRNIGKIVIKKETENGK